MQCDLYFLQNSSSQSSSSSLTASLESESLKLVKPVSDTVSLVRDLRVNNDIVAFYKVRQKLSDRVKVSSQQAKYNILSLQNYNSN